MRVEKIYKDRNGNIVKIKQLWEIDANGYPKDKDGFDAEQRKIDPDWYVNWNHNNQQ